MRRHLENLTEAGLIDDHEATSASRGRGRPARSFVLSAGGHRTLESDYDHLATEALRFLSSEVGDDAVRRFAGRASGGEQVCRELASTNRHHCWVDYCRPLTRDARRIRPPRRANRDRGDAHPTSCPE